jgi:hypothetical protein
MTVELPRFNPETEYDAPEPYAVMGESSYGSYIHRDQLKDRLQKALTSASPFSAQADAFREVIAWLGED